MGLSVSDKDRFLVFLVPQMPLSSREDWVRPGNRHHVWTGCHLIRVYRAPRIWSLLVVRSGRGLPERAAAGLQWRPEHRRAFSLSRPLLLPQQQPQRVSHRPLAFLSSGHVTGCDSFANGLGSSHLHRDDSLFWVPAPKSQGKFLSGFAVSGACPLTSQQRPGPGGRGTAD